MFVNQGWVLTNKMSDASLVQFVGGEDVTPSYYGHHPHPATSNNEKRDLFEALQFKAAEKLGLPMAGICRGAQFLNVMCGGALWQHVENHGRGHMAEYVYNGSTQQQYVTSTHHQMMIPAPIREDFDLLMVATEGGRREKCNTSNHPRKIIRVEPTEMNDVEALHYKRQRCFCFQPHPEMEGANRLASLYFAFLAILFNLE